MLQDQLSMAEEGVAAFNAPFEMTLGQESNVRLVIGAGARQQALVRRLGQPGGRTGFFPIRIGAHMTATLTGTAFDILPDRRGERRDIGGGSDEAWLWTVIPRRRGEQILFLTVKLVAADGRAIRTFPAEPQRITVTITDAQRLDDEREAANKALARRERGVESWTSYLWTIAALIGALSAIVFGIRTFGTQPKKAPS